MLNRIISMIKSSDGRARPIITEPLDMIESEKTGQKLVRIANIDLLNGWLSDISAITKRSQSQIIEEIVMQQFVPHNRPLQTVVESMYCSLSRRDTEKEIEVATIKAIGDIFTRRTGASFTENYDMFSYLPLVMLVYDSILGLHVEYDTNMYKDADGEPDPMHHLMYHFEVCGKCVADALGDEYKECLYESEFGYYLKGWNDGDCTEWFSPVLLTEFLGVMIKYWDFRLGKNKSAYNVVYDLTKILCKIAKRDQGHIYFSRKERVSVLSFINDLDEYILVNGVSETGF